MSFCTSCIRSLHVLDIYYKKYMHTINVRIGEPMSDVLNSVITNWLTDFVNTIKYRDERQNKTPKSSYTAK